MQVRSAHLERQPGRIPYPAHRYKHRLIAENIDTLQP